MLGLLFEYIGDRMNYYNYISKFLKTNGWDVSSEMESWPHTSSPIIPTR